MTPILRTSPRSPDTEDKFKIAAASRLLGLLWQVVLITYLD